MGPHHWFCSSSSLVVEPVSRVVEPVETTPTVTASQRRDARKTMTRVERRLERLEEREAALHEELAEHAADYERLGALDVRLREVTAEKAALEEEWLAAATIADV